MDPKKTMLSIGEASEYLGVSIDTLRRWEKKGKLITLRSPGGHRYFKKDNLDSLFGRKYERAPETKPRRHYKKVQDQVQVQDKAEDHRTADGLQTTDNGKTEDILTPRVNDSPPDQANQQISETILAENVQVQEDTVTEDNIKHISITESIKEFRKIEIPKVNPIKVIREIPFSVEPVMESNIASIPHTGFFPSITPHKHPINEPNQSILSPQSPQPSPDSEIAPVNKSNSSKKKNKIILIIIIIIGVLLIAGAVAYLILTPTEILSPLG
jgi:excisionase family DNA binding protein